MGAPTQGPRPIRGGTASLDGRCQGEGRAGWSMGAWGWGLGGGGRCSPW